MKKLLLTSLGLIFALYVLQAQTNPPEAIFIIVDAKPDKDIKDVAKDVKKALKKLKGDVVSEFSKSSFASEFGNVQDVTWQRQDYFDVATFTKNGKRMKAYFDIKGELVGTVTEATFEELPVKAKEYITKKYSDYTVGDVILYTDNENQSSDILLFGSEVESATNYFVELNKENKRIILKVSPDGNVSFFKELKS